MDFSCALIASSDCAIGGVGGKVAGIDAALEFGERDHEGIPVMTRQVTEGLGMEQA